MSFVVHKDQAGQAWQVDADGIKQMVRSYVRSGAVLRQSRLNYEKQEMGMLGVLFPLTIVTVHTDYAAVKKELDDKADRILKDLNTQIRQSGKQAFNTLVGFRNETVDSNEAFREMQMNTSQQTNEAVTKVQGKVSTAQTWTTVVRDLSVDTLMWAQLC